MNRPVRVLIVDDSAFARKVLRQVLTTSPDIEVVGIARDGLEALEKIAEQRPDVVTLDLIMPNLGGLGVLEALAAQATPDAPRVVIVSISDADSELAITAFELGAVDLVCKPTALATDRLYELGDELVRKVKTAALARRPALRPALVTKAGVSWKGTRRLVVLGTSTGGPHAIASLLASLPADFPVPLAIALHIPAGYTKALASRLNENCAIAVAEAENGMTLRPGLAVIGPGGRHLKIRARGAELYCLLSDEPADAAHFPSVDVLFESAVEQCGAAVVGLVLTGMGNDGCRGAGKICAAGGLVLTESAESCVVYGMPRSVVEAGFSHDQAVLSALGALLLTKL